MTFNSSKLVTENLISQSEEEDYDKKEKKKTCVDYLLIKENAKWKAGWDIFINLLVAYSCFMTIY